MILDNTGCLNTSVENYFFWQLLALVSGLLLALVSGLLIYFCSVFFGYVWFISWSMYLLRKNEAARAAGEILIGDLAGDSGAFFGLKVA